MLPNISQSKGNKTMKFGQLTEYNKINIFLQKSLSDCLYLSSYLGNMCTAIVCFPCYHVIHSKIKLSFLIKPLFYITKKARQKFKYLENEKSF